MFDNEIDWVTHLKIEAAGREACRFEQVFSGV